MLIHCNDKPVVYFSHYTRALFSIYKVVGETKQFELFFSRGHQKTARRSQVRIPFVINS